MKRELAVLVFLAALPSCVEQPAAATKELALTEPGVEAGNMSAPRPKEKATTEQQQKAPELDAGSLAPGKPQVKVTIEQPRKDQVVTLTDDVSGTTSDPNESVWVVIQPRTTQGVCWVQGKFLPDSNGHWGGSVTFGRVPPLDQGEHYEVRAFLRPSRPLTQGAMSGWPDAAAHSDPVFVVRQ